MASRSVAQGGALLRQGSRCAFCTPHGHSVRTGMGAGQAQWADKAGGALPLKVTSRAMSERTGYTACQIHLGGTERGRVGAEGQNWAL